MTIPVLEIDSMSKSFGGEVALSSVDLTLDRGEVRGLIGANGSGKSTLVKLLAGYHRADRGSGSIRVDGIEVDPFRDGGIEGFRFIHQDLGLISEMSVCDNLVMRRTPLSRSLRPKPMKAERSRSKALIDTYGMSFTPETAVRDLSATERTMVAVMRALWHGDDELRCLVLDEVTAALPPRESDLLIGLVRELPSECAVLFVSHSMNEVMSTCDTATVLRAGRNVGDVMVADSEERTLIQLLTGRPLGELYPEVHRPGEDAVLSMRGVNGVSVTDLDIDVHRGAIVGLASLDQAEAASVLSLVYGTEGRLSGDVWLEDRALDPRWGPPETSELGIRLVTDRLVSSIPSFTVRENMTAGGLRRISGRWRLSERRERLIATELIQAFAVVPPNPEATFAGLSGGNQQKVVLARSMRLQPKLLLLDDPSRGVDIGAKAAMYRVLRNAADDGLAVLIASTDLDELAALCHSVVVLKDGRVNAVLGGRQLDAQDLLEHCYVDRTAVAAHGSNAPDGPRNTKSSGSQHYSDA